MAVALFVCACVPNRDQSAIDPRGPVATVINSLFSLMWPIAGVVYLLVIGILIYIVFRRPGADDDAAKREASAGRIVALGVGVTVVLLFALLLADFSVARRLAGPPASVLTIRITGHQWWWEIEYEDSVAQNRVLLANELHVPVGRPVMLKLVSHDVIHSFWVPNLAGKKDLIPGHDSRLWIQADNAGVYRAQCAEFCGTQHANMALLVVAQPETAFALWLSRQRTASWPADSVAQMGRALFESRPCAVCHTVASTSAGGRVGPNLSHIGGRLTIAAGTLPNSRGNLTAWISNPQAIKPGVQMPPSGLPPEELRAIVAFLEALR